MKKTRNGMHIESNHAGLIGEHASRDKIILCESESLYKPLVYTVLLLLTCYLLVKSNSRTFVLSVNGLQGDG